MITTQGNYVIDSADTVWYVLQQFNGSNSLGSRFYQDVRCLPQSLGVPAPGQLLPYDYDVANAGTPTGGEANLYFTGQVTQGEADSDWTAA